MCNTNAAKWIVPALLGLALAGPRAEAGDYCPPPPPCGHYETIVVTKCVEVPYIKPVTLYDHCGRPYVVERTAFRTVKVAVPRRVFVRD